MKTPRWLPPRPTLVAFALACLLAGLSGGRPARAQIDPFRLSYGLYLVGIDEKPVLAGEVYRDDADPANYVEHWMYYPNYVAPDLQNGLRVVIVPGLRAYEDARDFLARVPQETNARYEKVAVATYRELPPTTCVTIQRGVRGDVADALINSGAGNDGGATRNYGASSSLTASLDANSQRFGLLRFDLASIPATATVVSAKLTLNVLLQGGAPVRAHVVTAPWSESKVTFASFDGAFDRDLLATFPAASAGQSTGIDVTDLAQGWVSGAEDNFGLLLERDAGASVFASSETANPALRPSLAVCYF